jgi:hypothetical protein
MPKFNVGDTVEIVMLDEIYLNEAYGGALQVGSMGMVARVFPPGRPVKTRDENGNVQVWTYSIDSYLVKYLGYSIPILQSDKEIKLVRPRMVN